MRTILISAYGCEPLKGSEAGVGWNWILQMAKTNYLHVITRANNQDSIEAHLPQDVKDRITKRIVFLLFLLAVRNNLFG